MSEEKINENELKQNEKEESNSLNVAQEKKISNNIGKNLFASVLDQAIVLAVSSLLILLLDFIMQRLGYRFVRTGNAIGMAVIIAYFVLNSIYSPVFERTNSKTTIAKRILKI